MSAPHQNLEGAANCTSCHVFGIGKRALKCLDCHTEIESRVKAKTGYHATAFRNSPDQLDCARCHSEHNGRRFQLTKFDRSAFNHATDAKFELQGKHATLKCESCHSSAHVSVRPAEIQVKDKNKTFLGLATTCEGCHQDPHQGELGNSCTSCHSQDVWKPAPSFDHNRAYPLTGRHAAVQCDGCHKPEAGRTVPRFRAVKSNTCDSCHRDPHQGAFASAAAKTACDSCHLTEGWKVIRGDFGFDHSRTKFPLESKHRGLSCQKCHTGTDFGKPVAHELCADCHKDVHQGQFATRTAGSDCSACHNLEGFKPSLYTLEEHQKAFRLEGKHEGLECAACHKAAGPDTRYRFSSTTCQSCHVDPHGSEFGAEPWGNRCESCHTQVTFHSPTFTLSKHQQTRFELTGSHIALACTDCHKPLENAPVLAKAAIETIAKAPTNVARQYHFRAQLASGSCTGCHQDPHETKQSCETCHSTEQWKAVRTFDHSTTRFQLEGAHRAATCEACHRPVTPVSINSRVKGKVVNFASTPTLCHDCHEDIHGGQFMREGEEKDCTSCHTMDNWNSRTFDHNKTKFSLEGAHEQVRCAQCHSGSVTIEGRELRLYRGAPTECQACHSDGKGIAQ